MAARFYLASLLLLLPVVDSHVLKSSQTVASPPNLRQQASRFPRRFRASKIDVSTKVHRCNSKQSCFDCVQTQQKDGRKCVYNPIKNKCQPKPKIIETPKKGHHRDPEDREDCEEWIKWDMHRKIHARDVRKSKHGKSSYYAQKLLKEAESEGTEIKDASVDPRMEPYNKHYALSVRDFRKITGNLGYCWRFATAQALGIPYLMYEKMVRTIQEYVKDKGLPASFGRKKLCAHNDKNCAHNKENWGPAKDSFEASEVLTKPLSVYKRQDLDTYEPAGNPSNMIYGLKLFVEELPHVPLYDTRKLQKFKNRLVYEDTFGENMNAESMYMLNTVLRHLIKCVEVDRFERPTFDSITKFFAATPTQKKTGVRNKNKKRRVLIHSVDGETMHFSVLLPRFKTDGTTTTVQLRYADGNGFKNDGQAMDFYEGAEDNPSDLFEAFKDWVKNGHPERPKDKDNKDPKRGKYVVQDYGRKSCSKGALVNIESECRQAAAANGKKLSDTGSWSYWPKGCFVAGGDWYFNRHSDGGAHPKGSPVCYLAEWYFDLYKVSRDKC